MGDLIFVAAVVTFFAATVAYVRACERIIGTGPVVEAPADAETEDAAGGPEATVGRAR
jgi:hypothetical protein